VDCQGGLDQRRNREIMAMHIDTTRFGTLQVGKDDLFLFPQGMIGMETLRQWVLLPDPENEAVAWLQSASMSERAFAVISPRVFVPDYRVHVGQRELSSLQLRPGDPTYVLTTLAGHVGHLTTNLRAPMVINLKRRLGCQVVTNDAHPLRHPVPTRVGKKFDPAAGSQPTRRAA